LKTQKYDKFSIGRSTTTTESFEEIGWMHTNFKKDNQVWKTQKYLETKL
jgi:hypothetical protein